jgi:endoglucanase
MGFRHVRINLHPLRDAKPDANHKVSEAWSKALDWAVEQALANKLKVILDFHDSYEMARDPVGLKERFLAIWAQIADRYKDQSDEVLFEILNEPYGKLTPELWNQFLKETLETIRWTNPNRTVVIGPTFWNDISHLDRLELAEEDRNLIVTVHYYRPMEFTHQGASWTPHKNKLGVPWDGAPTERETVTRDFDKAQTWAHEHRRPIYLGECGAIDKAAMSFRVRYISFVAREAEKRGWAWAYWAFDGDVIVDDIHRKRWIEPIRDALFPPR